MILSCQNLSKTFVDRPILKQASFQLEEHEKAAIVGVNGAGKTTLLKMIIGQLPADEGLITFAKDKTSVIWHSSLTCQVPTPFTKSCSASNRTLSLWNNSSAIWKNP